MNNNVLIVEATNIISFEMSFSTRYILCLHRNITTPHRSDGKKIM